MNKHRPGCCPGCNNGYAQANCTSNTSARNGCGCSSCGVNHGCGCNHNHGCSSCGGGCSSCGRNGFGTLRSVTGPFSNCSNWWPNDNSCFPYYTGPCGPCESCGNCGCSGCSDWPWPPMPPFMPVSGGYGYPAQSEYNTGRNEGCGHNGSCYTSHKNCYYTKGSCSDACAARQVKPIVDCSGCKNKCDCDD